MPSTVVELGFTVAGDLASFDEAAQTRLAGSLRGVLGCHEPVCKLSLRVAAGSVAVGVVLTIPDAPSGTATGSTVATSVAAAASALVAQPPSSIATSLGASVEAASPTVSVGTAVVPLVVAPPPPSPQVPPSTPPLAASAVSVPSKASPSPPLGVVNDAQNAKDSADGNSTLVGIIIGAAGAAALAAAVVASAFWMLKRRTRASKAAGPSIVGVGVSGSSASTKEDIGAVSSNGSDVEAVPACPPTSTDLSYL